MHPKIFLQVWLPWAVQKVHQPIKRLLLRIWAQMTDANIGQDNTMIPNKTTAQNDKGKSKLQEKHVTFYQLQSN